MLRDDPQHGLRRYAPALAAVLAQAVLVAVIYPSPSRFRFVGDAWGYLLLLRDDGLLKTVAKPIGYHWQPVAILFVGAIRRVVGDSAPAFQAVNLAQLVSLGFLTFLLARRVSGDPSVGFVAGLLYVGGASHYEVTYWALAGNMHLLSAQFFLASLLLAWEVGAGRLRRSGPWLLGACAVAALLSHPAMVTVVPLSAATLVLLSREQGEPWWRGGRRLALVLLVGVGLVGVAGRLHAHIASKGNLPPTAVSPEGLLQTAYMSAAMAQLRGSSEAGYLLMARGLGVGSDAQRLLTGEVLWLGGPLLALAVGWRASRRAGFKVLALFFVVHLYALGLGGALAPRQTIVALVPFVVLEAWGLHALAALAARGLGEAAAGTVRLLPMAAALVLVVAAEQDHRRAERLCLQAGDTMAALHAGVASAAPREAPPRLIVIVNPPLVLVEAGQGAQVFRNGAGQILRLVSNPASILDFRTLPLPDALPYAAGEPLAAEELRSLAGDASKVVFVCGHPPRLLRRVDAANVEDILAGR
jgi:hypothetical protein